MLTRARRLGLPPLLVGRGGEKSGPLLLLARTQALELETALLLGGNPRHVERTRLFHIGLLLTRRGLYLRLRRVQSFVLAHLGGQTVLSGRTHGSECGVTLIVGRLLRGRDRLRCVLLHCRLQGDECH